MENKNPVKVIFRTNDNVYEGYIYLEPDERLQDLLNDDRQFIPIYIMIEIDDPDFKCVQVNKSALISAEEFGPGDSEFLLTTTPSTLT